MGGFADSINYFLSQTLLNAGSSALKAVSSATAHHPANNNNIELWRISGSHHNFVKFAGLSGISAMASFASHMIYKEKEGKWDEIFEKANRFHFYHTIALLGCPLAKIPVITGSLLSLGTILFSGSLYYIAFTGKAAPFKGAAPTGGLFLILGWASFML